MSATHPSRLDLASWLDGTHARLATHYRSSGQLDSAIYHYGQALVYPPENAEHNNFRGLCYYSQQNYAAAIEDYRQAAVLNPSIKGSYYYNNLGTALVKFKDFPAVSKLLRLASKTPAAPSKTGPCITPYRLSRKKPCCTFKKRPLWALSTSTGCEGMIVWIV